MGLRYFDENLVEDFIQIGTELGYLSAYLPDDNRTFIGLFNLENFSLSSKMKSFFSIGEERIFIYELYHFAGRHFLK